MGRTEAAVPQGASQALQQFISDSSWDAQDFQDARMACGMKDYQVQGRVGWHHHMAFVRMAMLFMLEQRIIMKEERPTSTRKDIEYLLAKALPRKDVTFEDAPE